MTESDRRLVIFASSAIAALSLIGAVGLSTVIVLRLDKGEDVAPGIAALVMALFSIATLVVGFLAPSPLSKSATAPDEPVSVVGPEGGPVPVKETKAR